MPRRRRVTNPLGLAALAWLLNHPMHPYELGRRLQDSGKSRYIKYQQSSLYMVFSQLQKAGFIREQETLRNGRWPSHTVYSITDEGRLEVSEWVRSLLATPEDDHPQFAVALSVLDLLRPDDVLEQLDHRLTALAVKADRVATLIEDHYALAMIRAETEFVIGLKQSLSNASHIESWPSAIGSQI